MAVDLSGVLKSEFEKAKNSFEKAIEKGDMKLAGEKAGKCARLLRELAVNVPHQKAKYLDTAKKWEDTAESIANGSFKQKTVIKDEQEPTEEEFESQIEALISSSEVTWDDIGGLDEPKHLLMETVVIAALRKPEGIKPWRGILLFGPPGTGKTLLAAAAAGSLGATFFNVGADKVLSKYYGETSKLIGALYETATRKASKSPSIVFMDEFDALSPSRSGDVSEASRRALGTLLTQLDGFRDKKTDRLVLTLAATNTPWDLDDACLSRFPRRIYIPLPDAKATEAIIKVQSKGLDLSRIKLNMIAEECVRKLYSGRDIAYMCQQATWAMIREENKNLHKLSALPYEELRNKSLKTRPLEEADFESALESIKSPVTREVLEKHRQWADEFGG